MKTSIHSVIPEPALLEIQSQFRDLQPFDLEDLEDLWGDEDCLTGALAKTMRLGIRGHVGQVQWTTRVKKFRGRGGGALEKPLGADLIIEFEVKNSEGDVVWRKGVLGQSKKSWDGSDSMLVKQVRRMELAADGGSIVLDYRREGARCYAVTGGSVLRADGNRRRVPSEDVLPVGALLADRFLECQVGSSEMYYDASRERLIQPLSARKFHVGARIRTSVENV